MKRPLLPNRPVLINLGLAITILFLIYKTNLLKQKDVSTSSNGEGTIINSKQTQYNYESFVEATFDQIKKSFVFNKNLCSQVPDNLLGNFSIEIPSANFSSFSLTVNSSDHEGGHFLQDLKQGGSWEPPHCSPRHRVAIIIPYKDRVDNLNTWLFNMHPFLQRQEIAYTIFVVEQINDQLFNKGILMNAAFIEIFQNKKRKRFDCLIFHDVDLMPSDDLNMYTCSAKRPRHYSILVDDYDYRLSYPILVGGVISFMPEQYILVNGYSNLYWGWGAEDDDLYYRLKYTGVEFERPLRNTKYTMLRHKSRFKNPDRIKLLQEATNRKSIDGLNTVRYELYGLIKYPMFTHLLVNVGNPSG